MAIKINLAKLSLARFFFAPVLLILFVWIFVPYLTAAYPLMEEYHPYIMMFASMQTAILFGFITSFMILEEKEEHVVSVIPIKIL